MAGMKCDVNSIKSNYGFNPEYSEELFKLLEEVDEKLKTQEEYPDCRNEEDLEDTLISNE